MDGGGQTTTQSNEPWSAAQPFLHRGYESAESQILQRPTDFYPGSTVAPFSSETQGSLDATRNRALRGSPTLSAAQNYTTGLLNDPGSSPVFDSVMSAVRPGVDSMFAAGRRTGSPAHAEALGRGVTRGLAPYMESAAARAPGLAREDYYDLDRLGQVGTRRETQDQRGINEQIARHDYYENEPTRRTQSYLSGIRGLPIGGQGSSTTQNDKGGGETLLTAAALGLGGAGTAGGLGWQPLG